MNTGFKTNKTLLGLLKNSCQSSRTCMCQKFPIQLKWITASFNQFVSVSISLPLAGHIFYAQKNTSYKTNFVASVPKESLTLKVEKEKLRRWQSVSSTLNHLTNPPFSFGESKFEKPFCWSQLATFKWWIKISAENVANTTDLFA